MATMRPISGSRPGLDFHFPLTNTDGTSKSLSSLRLHVQPVRQVTEAVQIVPLFRRPVRLLPPVEAGTWKVLSKSTTTGAEKCSPQRGEADALKV